MDADVPDPLNRADVRAEPDLVVEALMHRAREDRSLGRPRPFPLPKPADGERILTVLDPMADLEYQRLLSPLALSIEHELGPEVFATRALIHDNSCWQAEPWRRARRRYKQALRSVQAAYPDLGVGTLDVRDHYATVDREHLARLLYTTRATDASVHFLIRFLRGLDNFSDIPSGLPIGPEASAILGTLALLALDRRLRRALVVWLRWVDDVSVLAETERDFLAIVEMIETQLIHGQQTLRPEKVGFTAGEGSSPTAPSMSETDQVLTDPAEQLEGAVECGDMKAASSPLGVLRSEADPRGVALVRDHPELSRKLPKQVGRYLRAVQDEVEWDWVWDRVLAPTTHINAAGQLHLMRAVPRRARSQGFSDRLFAKGAELSQPMFTPLRAQSFATAGGCGGPLRPLVRRALDLAEYEADFNCRRALIATTHHGELSRRSSAALRSFVEQDRDLSPTAHWCGLASA
jgi:hypothetical protein